MKRHLLPSVMNSHVSGGMDEGVWDVAIDIPVCQIVIRGETWLGFCTLLGSANTRIEA